VYKGTGGKEQIKMKFGLRKPNLKSSFKARTTGRLKRGMKRAYIPGYGKKGAGWVKDPKKAAYNKIYNKTTIGVSDVLKNTSHNSKNPAAGNAKPSSVRKATPKTLKRASNLFLILGLFLILLVLFIGEFNSIENILVLALGAVIIIISFIYRRAAKSK
jgi:hypothetical protein